MNRTPAAVLAFCLCSLASTAQAAEPQPNPTGEGAGALLFSVGGIAGTPSLFDGVGIGALYFTGERLALRGTLGFQTNSTSIDYGSGRADDEESQAGVTVGGGVEYILVRSRNLNIWTGGLLQVGTASSEDAAKTETADFSLALSGSLGADWFFSENVSLGAEYRLGVRRLSQEVNPNGSSTKDVRTQTQLGVSATGLRLGFWW